MRICFNPTLVRLRHKIDKIVFDIRRRFNPTLVRLRQIKYNPRIRGIVVFQSHAGSIEAQMAPFIDEVDVLVSIPRWFD